MKTEWPPLTVGEIVFGCFLNLGILLLGAWPMGWTTALVINTLFGDMPMFADLGVINGCGTIICGGSMWDGPYILIWFLSLISSWLFLKFTWQTNAIYGNPVTIIFWHGVWFMMATPMIVGMVAATPGLIILGSLVSVMIVVNLFKLLGGALAKVTGSRG